ncbi:MAG: FkbM family methyltransferase [Spirochaetaceae bacterium]|nr:FkbM family methyltransferase [Spirochaetaceae bacterium]
MAGEVRTFVEIGCADFDTLIPLAEAGAWRGFCVEPVPHLAATLRKMAAGLPVTIIEAAVTSQTGRVSMRVPTTVTEGSDAGIGYVNTADHAGSRYLERPEFAYLSPADLDDVEALTLDALLDRIDVATVDLLKVDTEGHELNIFRAYSWKVRPAVIKAEHIGSPGDTLQKLLEKLAGTTLGMSRATCTPSTRRRPWNGERRAARVRPRCNAGVVDATSSRPRGAHRSRASADRRRRLIGGPDLACHGWPPQSMIPGPPTAATLGMMRMRAPAGPVSRKCPVSLPSTRVIPAAVIVEPASTHGADSSARNCSDQVAPWVVGNTSTTGSHRWR